MAEFKQERRFLKIDTPLGEDELLLQSFVGHEEVSQLFEFRLRLLSLNPNVSFDAIVGQPVTIRFIIDEGQERFFHGYVSRFGLAAGQGIFAGYEATVVPWLWFLSRTTDCKIFQNKTVPDIIEEVFGDYDIARFENKLQRDYREREYCVQYRETDYNFVMRLMEQEGIFFFFKHEQGRHTLVMADDGSVFEDCPFIASVRFHHGTEQATTSRLGALADVITEWTYAEHFTSGKLAHTDYNFETPSTSLLANTRSVVNQGGNDRFELYDYPGEYVDRGEGQGLARTRIEEVEAGHTIYTGGGNCRTLASGHTFELYDHFRDDQNDGYVLLSVYHEAFEKTYQTAEVDAPSYVNRFAAIPRTVRFRPERITPMPFVHGVQTAVVVGPSGEEIYTDEYGRVKVQFHWDRYGNNDEHSSCWIRVGQLWAGQDWGGIHIPRIGQEVIVDFLEGDPDRPLITGRVYNAERMPPYPLPDQKTRSGIKSRSSKEGSAENFNELRFEDLKGEEMVYLHAERDFDTYVERRCREYIGADRHLVTAGHRREHIQKDATLKVDQNHLTKVGQSYGLEVGMDMKEENGMNRSAEVGMAYYLKAGMSVVIEAGVSLTIKAGGGFITIDPSGVSIVGTMVRINSGGAAGVGTPVTLPDPEAPEVASGEAGTSETS